MSSIVFISFKVFKCHRKNIRSVVSPVWWSSNISENFGLPDVCRQSALLDGGETSDARLCSVLQCSGSSVGTRQRQPEFYSRSWKFLHCSFKLAELCWPDFSDHNDSTKRCKMMCGCVLYSLCTVFHDCCCRPSAKSRRFKRNTLSDNQINSSQSSWCGTAARQWVWGFVIVYKYTFIVIDHVHDAHTPGYSFYIS